MIKKYFKKLVSVALAAAMVMGMSVTAFANETPVTNNNETKITLNEYELAEQLAAQTPETLSEEGFDSDEIACNAQTTVPHTFFHQNRYYMFRILNHR